MKVGQSCSFVEHVCKVSNGLKTPTSLVYSRVMRVELDEPFGSLGHQRVGWSRIEKQKQGKSLQDGPEKNPLSNGVAGAPR